MLYVYAWFRLVCYCFLLPVSLALTSSIDVYTHYHTTTVHYHTTHTVKLPRYHTTTQPTQPTQPQAKVFFNIRLLKVSIGPFLPAFDLPELEIDGITANISFPPFRWVLTIMFEFDSFLQDLFLRLDLSTSLKSGYFNCGGIIYITAPVLLTFAAVFVTVILKSELLLVVGIKWRNRAVDLPKKIQPLYTKMIDLATAVLLYIIQITVMSCSGLVLSGLLLVERSCDPVDHVIATAVGPVWSYSMLFLLFIYSFFLFAGPPTGQWGWLAKVRRRLNAAANNNVSFLYSSPPYPSNETQEWANARPGLTISEKRVVRGSGCGCVLTCMRAEVLCLVAFVLRA